MREPEVVCEISVCGRVRRRSRVLWLAAGLLLVSLLLPAESQAQSQWVYFNWPYIYSQYRYQWYYMAFAGPDQLFAYNFSQGRWTQWRGHAAFAGRWSGQGGSSVWEWDIYWDVDPVDGSLDVWIDRDDDGVYTHEGVFSWSPDQRVDINPTDVIWFHSTTEATYVHGYSMYTTQVYKE